MFDMSYKMYSRGGGGCALLSIRILDCLAL